MFFSISYFIYLGDYMMKRSDFKVGLINDSWMTSEVASQAGFAASRRAYGAKITVSYSGQEALRWVNVDVYLMHDRTKCRSVHTSATSITVRGAEVFTVRLKAMDGGSTSETRQALASKYAGGHGYYDAERLPASYQLLRIYGETRSGEPFAFALANPVPTLSETDSQCFIATAAFESSDHPAVTELRRVRDELLLPTSAGRAFVKFYYRHSPHIAKWMSDRPRVKRATRAILTPLARSTRALSSVRRDGWRSLFQNKL